MSTLKDFFEIFVTKSHKIAKHLVILCFVVSCDNLCIRGHSHRRPQKKRVTHQVEPDCHQRIVHNLLKMVCFFSAQLTTSLRII